jgi:HSP20 family protein
MAGLVPFNKRGTSLCNKGFDDFYNMLDDFFNDGFSFKRNLEADTFKIDVAENEKEYLVEADLPGVKKEELNVDMTEGRLTISVAREENKEDKTKNYIHKERRYSSMARSVYLADTLGENIKAKLDAGTLTIIVPKAEKKENKQKIDIE